MTLAVVYATPAAAAVDQAKVAAALGYPRCSRLAGTDAQGHPIPPPAVPVCGCTGDGLGPNVHASCPYATRQQTDVVTDTLSRPCLVVDAVMQASPAVLAAVPAVATAVVIALPAPTAIGDAIAEVP